MSDLLLTLSSDDEEEYDENETKDVVNKKDKKKNKRKRKNVKESSSSDADADDDDGNDSDMNDDFEFGGLLGEDGDANTTSSILSSLTNGDNNNNAWSYKSALKILQYNDSTSTGRNLPQRMDVASIIAAARSNLKKESSSTSSTKDEQPSSVKTKDDDDDTDSVVTADEGESDSDSDSHSNEEEQSESEEDQSDDDEVDDTQEAEAMQEDVLKVRENASSSAANKGSTQNDETNEEEEDADDSASSSSTVSDSEEDEEARIEAAKAANYFDSTIDTDQSTTTQQSVDVFVQLNLSRPLLRGVASMGFVTPTPIQARVIPVALSGRDVCASAQTGSGKTAAFLLPIMERILQRGGGRVQLKHSTTKRTSTKVNSHHAATKGLILTPTRELAAQCLGMMTAMAKFTDLRASLVVGGAKNVAAQAAELRTRPNVVIATPGRLLDHLTNSSGVDLDDLEFLILDEADRLLDLGFQDEVHEIVKSCPMERQTLLFSATMGTKVDELIKLSLKRPVRVHVTDQKNKGGAGGNNDAGGVEVANRLEQEFVRVRSGNEGVNREAMLLALLTRTFKSKTIVFFDTKADAHRLMIICGLCGIQCTELHGNLTQTQRLEALENFRDGSADVLLATDLAARGLDISSVEAVVNFEMPSQVETYVHRIGRTARAGRGGKSCTLIGEGRRHLMKAVMKDAETKRRMIEEGKTKEISSRSSSTGVIRSRTIPQSVIAHFVAKIISLKPHINEVIAAEAVARMDRITEMEAMKAQNIIRHSDDIKNRPQKEWFASSKQKISAKEAAAQKQQMIAEKVGTGMHRMTRKKRRVREAREDFLEFQEEERREAEESGRQPKKAMTEATQKTTAKAHKRSLAEKAKAKDQESLYEQDMEEQRRKKKKEKTGKKRKGAFASDSLGDSGLFEDAQASYAKKETQESAKSSYKFRGFNPDKIRKNKKKSTNAFKSRSKHKRR